MPQIRDYALDYTASAATSLQNFMPWYQAGDLMLAVLNATSTSTTSLPAQTWSNTAAFITTASISGTTLTVYSFNGSTPISPGLTIQTLSGSGATAQTIITGQISSSQAPVATTTAQSGGTANTCTFTASSTSNIAVSQFVTGNGIPASTYVSTVVGNVITLTQNFTSNASGTINFYNGGQTGVYTVNNSQTVANTTFTANWSTLYSQSNGTLNSAVLWKIASSAEPDPLFSYTTSSQSQGHIIAVQDVNPAAPFNGTAITPAVPAGPRPAIVANTGVITSNASATFAANAASGIMWVNTMYAGAIAPGMRFGTGPVSAITLSNIRIVNQINGQTISASGTFSASSINTITLTSVTGTIAAGNLVGQTTGIAAGTYVTSWFSGNSTAILSQNLTGTPSGTINFFVPGFTGNYTMNQSFSAATRTLIRSAGFDRSTMPQLTTTVNNSLIMYLNVDGTAVSPGGTIAMVAEGPCVYEQGADGTAQSQGFSWGIQRIAGTTPANVYWNKLGSPNTANAIVTTISVSPPSGGATVIPPYCASDASYLIDYLSGSNSYNVNGIVTAGTTGIWGTSLNGAAYTVNNATPDASTDVGINSYHSMALTTGTAVNKQWGVVSWSQHPNNLTDVTGKNILLHLKSQTPKALQNTDGIGRTGVKGLAFGMASTAGSAYKVWHVHGQGTVWNAATYVPVVINSNATKGLLANVGTLNPANVSYYGLFLSGTVTAPNWNFGTQWALDTTVIAGGNQLYPVGLNGILHAAAEGKERLSVIQQGAEQSLILQPIQLGNGGTDPLYLNLDSTVIEFPKQYDVPSNQVYYCSADNVVGITYYAGPTDTIIHTNGVVSSQSPFYWRFNPSTSASATYSFVGTSIAGAGNIVLSQNVPLNGMVFANCVEVLSAGGNITSTVFQNTVSGTGGALKIVGNALTIQSALNTLANCTFTNNTLASGALHIVYNDVSTSNIAVVLTTSSLSFAGNNYDIYWDAPVNTPLTFQQTGIGVAVATTWQATNNNTAYLPPIRNLIINGIIDGSNVTVYTQQNPLVPIAGPTTVSSGNVNAVISNLLVGTDTVNTGKYTATYSFVYPSAFANITAANNVMTVSTVISGNIALGQTVDAAGIPPNTTVQALGTGRGGTGTYILSNTATASSTGVYTTFDTPVNIATLSLNYQDVLQTSILTFNGAQATVYQILDRQYKQP